RAGQAVLMTTNKSGITWSHTYGWRDHPVYFCLKILTDASAVVSFGGLGLLLLYVSIRSAVDPSAATVSGSARKLGSRWAIVSASSILLYLALSFFPYLIRWGVLS